MPAKPRPTTAITILITALVGLAIQFGLAILGWGGWSAFWNHPQFQALVWVSIALGVAAMFSGSSGLSTGEKEDKGNRWVLTAFTVIALLLAYLSAMTDRIDFWTVGGDAARWAGVVICAAGGVLRIAPVFVLRERFSGLVAIQSGHRLATTGLYGVIRNPSYLGLLISSLGWALAFRSGVGLILGASLLLPLVARMHAEERMLHDHFGAEYDAYRARTWRLVPWVY
ncbi:MAG TPA: isoprenylcysteine carboxylmethyltransferase family protein [Gemmatimonadaceae bacterium]|nr:isoprenylcysteine carboxylmethyltransferase family protein [Gemmatimonadaceae bacterium]